mmetsp:Transcript_8496/g.23459  ORF Transcript_8496/g.23459 Transcript_8496/m.23459 type:complete len:319 (+) Transcript_8496:156-1112(+)
MADFSTVSAAIPADDEEAWRLLRRAEQVPRASLVARAGLAPEALAHAAAGASGAPTPPSQASASAWPGAVWPASTQNSREHMLRAPVVSEPADHMLPRPQLKAPLDRVAELEGQIAEGLSMLLQESRQGIVEMRRGTTQDSDRAMIQARHGGIEAELEFRRLTDTGSSSGTTAQQCAALEREIASLASSQPSMSTPSMVHSALGPTQLPNLVSALAQSCQRQAAGSLDDKTIAYTVAAVHGLGDMLLEIDRDCQALVLALANAENAELVGGWSSRLGLVAAERSQLPSSEALARQLEHENELLKEVLNPSQRVPQFRN